MKRDWFPFSVLLIAALLIGNAAWFSYWDQQSPLPPSWVEKTQQQMRDAEVILQQAEDLNAKTQEILRKQDPHQ